MKSRTNDKYCKVKNEFRIVSKRFIYSLFIFLKKFRFSFLSSFRFLFWGRFGCLDIEMKLLEDKKLFLLYLLHLFKGVFGREWLAKV